MQRGNLPDAEKLTKQNNRRRIWKRIVGGLGCVVVFCTTYALILPAITQERETWCGYEAHIHEDACYAQTSAIKSTVCSRESLGIHSHTTVCYGGDGALVCELPDKIAHVHDEICYDTQGNLVCQLPEVSQHVHTEDCYAPGETEPAVLHAHSDSCYTSERGELTCTAAESEGHSHGDTCYADGELVCELAEEAGHTHVDACYKWNSVLSCGMEEGEAEPAETVEPVLACTEPVLAEHVHSESCFVTTADDTLTCTLEENEEHTHSERCYGVWEPVCGLEEHEHTLSCYSDPEADVETAQDWEASFANVELTGDWHQDDVLIAESQLGYHESTANYAVWEDESTHGYTRYGDWYGIPYGDWCAMFVSFCLDYAGVEGMPYDNGCRTWIDTLSREEYGLYRPAAEHTPVPGEIVFFDWEGDGLSDHVGIVAEIIEATDTEPAQIKTIEGNSSNCVQYVTYALDSEKILGYSELPNPLTEEQLAEVNTVIQLIEEMPSADEIDAKIAEFEEAEDYEGEEAWLTEVYQQVADVYRQYSRLNDVQKNRVTNADKLLELEYIWSTMPLAVTTSRPTIYQINSYDRSDGVFDGDSDAALMVHGGTVNEKINVPTTWIFSGFTAIIVEEDSNGYLRVESIDSSSSNKLGLKADTANGFVLLFYRDVVIVDADVGDYVTVHFTIPSVGHEKSEGYGTISFSSSPSGITSDTPTPISSASTKDFVELNLYDYNGYINTNYWSKNNWYPGFQWNGGAYAKSSLKTYDADADLGIPNYTTDRNYIDSIDFGNSLITNYTYGGGTTYAKSVNATNVTKTSANYSTSGPINWIYGNDTEGYTNKPIGTSTTDVGYTDVLKDTLVSGYPALSDGTMLDYLFKPGTAVTKMNTGSIDGLFKYKSISGLYSFNSRENHAQYVRGEDRFQLYKEIITPNFITYPFGNFLPLNTITDSSKATQVGAFNYSGGMRNYVERIIADLKNDAEGLGSYWTATQRQLATMLEEYEENWNIYPRTFNSVSNSWENLSPANAIRDYFWGDTSGSGDAPTDSTSFITQAHLDNMYNIDWDVQTNFFFGMEMKMEIMMPKDGLTGNDVGTNGNNNWTRTDDNTPIRTGSPDGIPDYPMVFAFSGDDDVWVYVDGVLFLDLSGIHRHVGGVINFETGKVSYFGLDVETGDVKTNSTTMGDSLYLIKTFEEILRAAGKDDAYISEHLKKDADGNYTTFKDYTTHSFNFYYMERGSGSSICRMEFNFPMLKKNSIEVTKEEISVDSNGNTVNTLGNPDYYFNIVTTGNQLFVGPGSVTGIDEYKIKDSNGNILKDANGNEIVYKMKAEDYGIFTLKAGQTAVFEGVAENQEGIFFVQELIKAEDNSQYSAVKINLAQDATVGGVKYSAGTFLDTRYNQLVDWRYRTYFAGENQTEALYTGPHGYEWYARSGYNTDALSSSSFHFEQQNYVDVTKLGSLSISKTVDAPYSDVGSPTFQFQVKLDGELLPTGTSYKVGTETRQSLENGIIQLSHGETALIENILTGTAYEVTELTTVGYNTSYTVTPAANGTVSNGVVSGKITVDTDVSVQVTNTQIGAAAEIPVTKNMSVHGGASSPRTYTFRLQEVNGKTDLTAKENGWSDSKELTFGAESTLSTLFRINYLPEIFAEEETTKIFYYKITEDPYTASEDDVRTDETVYLAEVTVTKGTNSVTSEITGFWIVSGEKLTAVESKTVTFTNTLIRNLILTKTVVGSQVSKEKEYEFAVTFATGASNAEIPDTISGVLTKADGTVTNPQYTVENGKITVKLADGDTLKLKGIPYKATWTVEELDADGFAVTYTVSNKTSGSGTTVSGTTEAKNTTVAFTNTQMYQLPKTGGAGTQMYTMAGLMLMLIGTAFLLYKVKKRGREVA